MILLNHSDHKDIISSVFGLFVPNFPLQIRLSQLEAILFSSAHTCAFHHPNTSGLCPYITHLVHMTTAAILCGRQLIHACINIEPVNAWCTSAFHTRVCKEIFFPSSLRLFKTIMRYQIFGIILSTRPFKCFIKCCHLKCSALWVKFKCGVHMLLAYRSWHCPCACISTHTGE